MSAPVAADAGDPRAALRAAADALEQVLPGQAPLRDFVHHNTLHGFQHLPFRQAVSEAARRIGAQGFPPIEQFRAHYRRGRIGPGDLDQALLSQADMAPETSLAGAGLGRLRRADVYLVLLHHSIEPIVAPSLRFRIEERDARTRFQPDVPAASRERLLDASASNEAEAIDALWTQCLKVLGLTYRPRHPESLTESGPVASEAQMRAQSDALREALIGRVGQDWTLRDLMWALIGEDMMNNIRPMLLRHLASHLDQGTAAWHNPARARGFFAAWRGSVESDLIWGLIDLPEWRQVLERLPPDATDAVMQELRLLGIPEQRWTRYLERLALELPGWSGMFLRREHHPLDEGAEPVPVRLIDLLAVRLVLERLFAHGMCRRRWRIEPTLAAIRWHFRHHPAELLVRHAVFNERLPEHLLTLGRRLMQQATFSVEQVGDTHWQDAADRIATWRHVTATQPGTRTPHGTAWPLFVLCQHLGIAGGELAAAGEAGARALLDCMDRLDEQAAGWIWLLAYERHYRDRVLSALRANRGRGPWATRADPPEAQLVFCMDDREEGLRRHLEEVDPRIETLGAAAHFNVPHAWRGLNDRRAVALAPVVPVPVIPDHEVREVPRGTRASVSAWSARRHAIRIGWRNRFYQGTRHGVAAATLLTAAGAPAGLAALAGRLIAPPGTARLIRALRDGFERPPATGLALTAAPDAPPATPRARRPGYTDLEQAERVESLLRAMGLTGGFAPLVVIAGHASSSRNNPHASAYNCGACGGRFSGPNARLVCAMANRAEVRTLLGQRGIRIPPESWFVGAEHDTCTDALRWYDLEDLPVMLRPALTRLRANLDAACRLHAAERCRRFASAPARQTALQAHRHVAARAEDLSQARPELGHATNACAFIGRRAMSRGAFFDRRAFLISYDPTQDEDGAILERHLLTNGAVGAGISLEYYFSTANNERYGCGTKVVHNLTGSLGVMEGANSDLRTGLPRQMIEIHEPMRLLVVVEQTTGMLSAIYDRQPPLRELVGNGWIQLAAIDPRDGAIHWFEPGRGWVGWEDRIGPPPAVERSAEWTAGHSEALPPALIRRSATGGGAPGRVDSGTPGGAAADTDPAPGHRPDGGGPPA